MPGRSNSIAQHANLVGDDAEILGDERGLTELRAQRRQQRVAAAVPPFAEPRRRRTRRDRPIGLERAEVVDAQQVEPLELAADAVEPPAEAVPLHGVPVV